MMTAVLDACTILNLILVHGDERYIKYIENTFDEILITTKVFDEVRVNKFENLLDSSMESQIETIIYDYLAKYVVHDDPKDVCEFVEISVPYHKKNGEFFSLGHSLAKSRLGSTELRQSIFNVHFITDDEPATKEFGYFYRINVIGQIINSIDLMTILCLKGHIGKGELEKYCGALKLLYNRTSAVLVQEIKQIKDFAENLTAKHQLALTELLNIINELGNDAVDKVNELLEKGILSTIMDKHKRLDKLIQEFLSSNFKEKIPSINNRIADFDKIWELDYA